MRDEHCFESFCELIALLVYIVNDSAVLFRAHAVRYDIDKIHEYYAAR